MSSSIDIEDLQYSPSCGSCGAEYMEQEDVDTLVYSRTTASGDVYYCTECGEENIHIENQNTFENKKGLLRWLH